MLKIFFILFIAASALYAFQNPNKMGNAYNTKDNLGRVIERPLEERENMPRPTQFLATSIGHNSSSLSWNHPYNSNQKFAYQIYRNKVLLAELPSSQQIFKDQHLSPDRDYHYEIFAVDNTGWRSAANSLTIATSHNATPSFIQTPNMLELQHNLNLNSEIHKFYAQDANNDPLTFTIKGTDKTSFSINSETGTLTTQKYLVRDNKYHLQIEVSDGNSSTNIPFIIKT